MIFRKLQIIGVFFLFLFFGYSIAFADQTLVQKLSDSVKGKARISYHAGTGKVRFIGTSASGAFPQPSFVEIDAQPESAARNFLNVYGRLFGLASPDKELKLNTVKEVSGDRSVVKFQQIHNGLPVIAGEMIVNMDRTKNIRSINGEVSPGIVLDTNPLIDSQQAQERALAMVSKKYNVPEGNLEILSSQLSIYNPALLGHQMNRNFLVWQVIVKSNDVPVKEFVLIDARAGMTLLSFNQIDAVLNRQIYDNQNKDYYGLPGYGPVRTEGQAPYSIADVNFAYDYMGDTYDFYWMNHSRDSIDGAGMSLVATVRYCDPFLPSRYCPYQNAFWNGFQMVFGQGFAADDVVGHELTHGVTDYESHLFYYMQAGAINESLSDIWGELIDQTNMSGTDTDAVRWKIGEDLPIGVIRNMKNPPAFTDPDSMLSTYYYCKSGDNGGVHFNSGVNNKAAYLMTDGGTFNSYMISPLGIEKVAKIYYEVQTNLLTSGADYQDLADALYQGCLNLIGDGVMTPSDCGEVSKAVNAVHMHSLPVKCKNIDVPLCNNGTATDRFFDDMENTGSGNWSSGALTGFNEWYYPQNPNPYGDATYTTSGIYNIWGYDYGVPYPYYNPPCDYYIGMTSSILLPIDTYMHFNHAYEFEYGTYYGKTYYFDGGILEYSSNNGATWQDASNLIVVNNYDGTIYKAFDNPLGGRKAFVGSSHGYISTKLNLSSLAGQSVRFRFRIGTDNSWDSLGWFIDDVRIYTCSSPDPSAVLLTYPNGGEILKPGESVNITWTGPSKTSYVNLSYSLDNGVTWKTIEKNITGNYYLWTVPAQTNNKKKCLIKVKGYNSKGVKIGSDKSDAPFTIEVLRLISPNGGGDPLISSDPLTIEWTSNTTKKPVTKVILQYTKDGGLTWLPIYTLWDSSYLTNGSHTHDTTVPGVTKEKTKCRVKVTLKDGSNNTMGTDTSDGNFTIQPSP